MKKFVTAVTLALFLTSSLHAADDFPPGWVPVTKLNSKPTWGEVREIRDRIHLYLPNEDKPVRGVFFAVGLKADGSRSASRPALAIVR